MKCPVCAVDLTMTERQGVEIDYCPQCRGVWLDRGELDKIIERSERDTAPPPRPRDYDDRPPTRGYDERRDDDPRYRRKKKKSFLSEIFEFGD